MSDFIDTIKEFSTPISTIIGSFVTWLITKKSNEYQLEKLKKETESLEVNDKILVNRYNQEQYNDLMNAYQELEKKYLALEQAIRLFQEERDEWKRKYNLFKNIIDRDGED